MVTLKIKAISAAKKSRSSGRSPVRGAGSGMRKRPTLAQSQAERAALDSPQPADSDRDESAARYRRAAVPTAQGHAAAQAPPARRQVRDTPHNERGSHSAPRAQAQPAERSPHERRANRPYPASGPAAQPPYPQHPYPPQRPYAPPRPAPQNESQYTPRNQAFGDAQQRRRDDTNTPNAHTNAPAPRPAHVPLVRSAGPSRFAAPFEDAADHFRRDHRRHSQPGPLNPTAPYTATVVRPNPTPQRRRSDPGYAPSRPSHEERAERHHEAPPGSMRLSKRMSELGMSSRREADEWIPKGWVRVDGKVVATLGARVMVGQHITIDAQARHQQAARVTVLINKPVGYVSGQAEDGYEPAYVLVTPDNQWREDHSSVRFLREHLRNLAPAGRLDIDSVGLLVLTQDGRIAKQLVGEDSDVEKEYLVRVRTHSGEALAASSLALLNHGLELDGQALLPAEVEWANDDQLRFVLHEGRKRQIRRMCEAVGLEVLGLKRVRIGPVMLGDLPAGKWRYLRGDEKFVELEAPQTPGN
jgi:23S rRNA pseudouridine2604 synthase